MTKKQEEFTNNELETQIEEGYRNLTNIAIIIAVLVMFEIALIILLRLYLVMAWLGVLLTGYVAWINLGNYKTFVPFIICSTLLIYLLFLLHRNETYTSANNQRRTK